MIQSCEVCFCKQKTAYEVRMSDWSSDVCSSDLLYRKAPGLAPGGLLRPESLEIQRLAIRVDRRLVHHLAHRRMREDGMHQFEFGGLQRQLGSASCRERVCQDV